MKSLFTLSLALMVLVAFSAMAAEEKAAEPMKPMEIKGEKVTMTGMASCTFCKLSHPEKSCTNECCVGCLKAGDPPSLTDKDGNMYILLTGEHEKPLMTPERMALMGGKITVTGTLVKGKGVQGIYVEKMEKAAEDMSKEKAAEMPKEKAAEKEKAEKAKTE